MRGRPSVRKISLSPAAPPPRTSGRPGRPATAWLPGPACSEPSICQSAGAPASAVSRHPLLGRSPESRPPRPSIKWSKWIINWSKRRAPGPVPADSPRVALHGLEPARRRALRRAGWSQAHCGTYITHLRRPARRPGAHTHIQRHTHTHTHTR